MDWSNERYVRIYTRDTPEWALLSWEARGLFCLLLRAVDRAGLLELGKHGTKAIAALLRMPLDVVERALPELGAAGFVDIASDRVAVIEQWEVSSASSPRVRLRSPEEREEIAKRLALEAEARAVAAASERQRRLLEREARRRAGRVYFVQQDGAERLVKIGWTRRDPSIRMKELQATQACNLVLLASALGSGLDERRLHGAFQALRVVGEWFRPGEDLLSYIGTVAERGIL